MTIELYSCWQPTNSHTGCGIVIRIDQIPASVEEANNGDGNLYHFVTDFGNTCRYTSRELRENYILTRVEDDIVARFKRQEELLQQVKEEYLDSL